MRRCKVLIRILQIGMSDSLGGIETFIINLYRNIDKNKFQFDFIDMTKNGICYKDEIERMGGKIYKVTPRKESIIKNKNELRKIIIENNYKIMHFHLNTLSYVTPIIIAQNLKNIKIIIHSHNQWKGKNIKTLFLDKINRCRIKKDKIIKLACSDVAGKWIFKNEKFQIIDNGIDLEKFAFSEDKRQKIRKELNIDEDCVVIGHVGAFREQKNHNYLIDIFNEYLKNNSNAMLLLIGEGNLKNEIQEKVNTLKITNKVKFLGLRNDTDYLYSSMDYFIFPSFFEGLPIAMIEAQASGVNCIASNKITDEVCINNNVKLIDINKKPNEWASEIKSLSDLSKRKIINKNLNKYNLKETIKKMEDIYNL